MSYVSVYTFCFCMEINGDSNLWSQFLRIDLSLENISGEWIVSCAQCVFNQSWGAFRYHSETLDVFKRTLLMFKLRLVLEPILHLFHLYGSFFQASAMAFMSKCSWKSSNSEIPPWNTFSVPSASILIGLLTKSQFKDKVRRDEQCRDNVWKVYKYINAQSQLKSN